MPGYGDIHYETYQNDQTAEDRKALLDRALAGDLEAAPYLQNFLDQ